MLVREKESRAEVLRGLGLRQERLPRHVAIIMDGNGRWAQRRGLPRAFGHRQGVRTVRTIVEEACRLEIENLTLFCLSSENWKRPQREIDQLMTLLKSYLINERPMMRKNNIRLKFLGRREGLPAAVQAEMDQSLRETEDHTGLTLGLAINYGGRSELVDVCRRLAADVAAGRLDPDSIEEADIDERLDTAGQPDPDLLIRTADEMRISNFLLWQISYAEIFVTDVCWPDFRPEHLHRALGAFASRERRFGGLGG